jgi:hypothetical protein
MKFVSSVALSALGLALIACSATTPGVSSAGPGGSHPGGATPGMGGGTGGSTGTGTPPKPDFGFTPPVTTAGGMSPDAKTCGEMAFNLQRSPAKILVVLDRSGSMTQMVLGIPNSKWDNVTAALNETVTATNASVEWGLKVFPQPGVGAEGCVVADGVDVPIAPMNAMAITGAISVPTARPINNAGSTPTTVAVNKATDYLKTLGTTTPKYMVLATDGLPNCRDGFSGDDAMGAVAAIQAAAAAGFHTFVVGIATMGSAADTTLNNMAVAGLEPRMAAPQYYPVASRADLVTTLGLITGQVTNCVFPLTMAPPATGDVTVKVNGMVIPRDPAHAQGWDLAGNAVQVYGAVCDQLKGGGGDKVEIVFGCFIP